MTQKQGTTSKPLDTKVSEDPLSKQAEAQATPDGRATATRPETVAQTKTIDGTASPVRGVAARRIPDSGDGGPSRPAVQQKRSAAAARHIPANDDMPSIGGLIYALQQRPSRSPFIIALVASGVWFVLGLLVSWAVFKKNFSESSSASDLMANPSIIAVIATIVVPIALFWFLSILVWRAQELRLMSSAMTEVAVRLAEPDRMAEQSVASLGQTVRRQVAAMNDAISRALGRAGELEALVHNEVAALERSYTENEHRIRNLVSELASEREALANNSERVSEALRGIGAQVTREITAASEKASQSLGQASVTMAETFTNRGQKITAAVTAAGTAIDEKLAERGARITEQLVKHGAQAAETLRQSSLEVTRQIQETSDRSAAAISAKGNKLVSSVIEMSEKVGREVPALLEKLGNEQTNLSRIIDGATRNLSALETALAEKTQSLGMTLQERTSVLQTVLSDQSNRMNATLTQRINDLETILSKRTEHFDVSLGERAKQLESTLSIRSQAIEATVAKQATGIRDTLERHSATMEQTLGRQAQQIERVVANNSAAIQRTVEELAQRQTSGSDALASQARTLKEVSAGLMGQLGGLTKRFEDQGSAIMSAARTFEMSNSKIDAVMEQRQAGLSRLMESIGGKAVELDRMMNSYSNMLEQSLSQAEIRARKVTEMLAKDSSEKSQAAIRDIERMRHEAQTHTAKAVAELQTNFSSLSDQVSTQLTTLSGKFADTTRTVRDSTRRATVDLESAQTELARHAKGLPETAKQSATAMRRALNDQLSALNQLSDISSRHSYASSVSAPDPQVEQRRRDREREASSQGQPPHDASFPSPRPGYEYGQPERPQWQQPEAVTPRPTQDQPPRSYHDEIPQQPVFQDEAPVARQTQWSLGDLLARASEDESAPFPTRDDYGAPPASPAVTASPGRSAPNDAMDFNMSDIAAAIDERRVMEVWQRLKHGETDILNQRGLYSRPGQTIVDRVRRRFETDATFRVITERYCTDFEKMLHDLSRNDPRGGAVQTNLASDNGRIYFVLAHVSGRLGA